MKRLIDALPGIRASTAPEDLICYGFDASGTNELPSAVFWPETAEDVVALMKGASENGIPVVPRGAGTGMTGGSVPLKGAAVLSTERMNRIIDLDSDNLNVLVEPGIINGRLQRAVEAQGLFYPPDPASMNFCTIGGNVAENAGGPRALKYGVTRDYVMEIEAVLPNADLIMVGVRTHKGVVGYDLARLLVGSEGTLAVATKIRLKLLPLPDDIVTLLCLFDDLEAGGKAVSSITAARIIPRTVEFMDGEAIKAVEKIHPLGIPDNAAALLLIEIDGHPEAIRKEAEKIADICMKLQGDVSMAEDDDARERLWECRRSVSPALYHLSPAKISEDIVVPRNRIPQALKSLKLLSEDSGIKIVTFGHAGDGNIHVNLMIDRSKEEEYRKAESLIKEIFRLTLDLGGTISGEHGIGTTKAPYIGMEIKEREMRLMKGIKNLFDPKNILNPGKIFPHE
ncbi:MAG TPA: FAD-linked oxidase C-terminal domain-containing protein [Thermodesulfovibrionales bacterium]|jgi:glycolate oxidase|nr:FAD-linked oxidase C-terminal domain-containing protein [Thermodesulfovibrionales bacterium]